MKIKERMVIGRVRLATGLILFAFVATHLLNHALGVVSIAAMSAMLGVALPIWGNPFGATILYGAALTHIALAYYALWRRRSLRMPPSQLAQYALGFLTPMFLAEHVTETRVDISFFHGDFGHYENVIVALAYSHPVKSVLQVVALSIAWTHGCIGLRYWLRLKPWYGAAQPWLYAFALLVPVLATLGFVAGIREIGEVIARDPGYVARVAASQPPPEARAALSAITDAIRILTLVGLAALLIARAVRHQLQRRRGLVRIQYPGGKSIDVTPGSTVLEASRILGVPHTSVCGGRGRCSTCRVRVRAAHGAVPEPSADEQRVLEKIAAPPNVRLACQLRPLGPVEVTPLLSPSTAIQDMRRRANYTQGCERSIAVLFADLREFTRLSESKLPYDVVFLLNRYYHAMTEAIETAGGRIDKFMGDGLMALFGLESDGRQACREALRATRLMSAALAQLNQEISGELDAPLAMGMGAHFGAAVIGDMGAGAHVALTAVGDAINTASRLEQLCKTYDCELVVSEDLVAGAGVDIAEAGREEVAIRGRSGPFQVRPIKNASAMRIPEFDGAHARGAAQA